MSKQHQDKDAHKQQLAQDRTERDRRALEIAAKFGLPNLTDDSSDEELTVKLADTMESMELDQNNTQNSQEQNDFQQITSRKRKTSQLILNKNKKPVAVKTSNRYTPLSDENETLVITEITEDTVHGEQSTSGIQTQKARQPKVPPITIEYTGRYLLINTELKKHVTGPIKAIFKGDSIKYHFESIADQKIALRFFRANNIAFYTHQNPEEKSLKVVFKYLPVEIKEEELATELQNLGFINPNVFQFKTRDENSGQLKPLPVYSVALPPGKESETVYDIKHILDTKVTVEAYRHKDGPPQCKRCQRFFHTANYCTLPARCVKCGQHHISKDCTLPREHRPTCANCAGDHAASWRGCPKYQEAIRIYNAQTQTVNNKRTATTTRSNVPNININSTREFPALRTRNAWNIPTQQPQPQRQTEESRGIMDDIADLLKNISGLPAFIRGLKNSNILTEIKKLIRDFKAAPDILSKLMVLAEGIMQFFFP